MKIKILFFPILISSIFLHAQSEKGKYLLDGTIIDLISNKTISDVTINVYSKVTKKELMTTTSNQNGNFYFKDLDSYNIRVRFSHVGYRTVLIDSVNLMQTSKLGFIALEPITIEMPEIVINSLKPMVEFHADKQVLNIDRTPGNSGSIIEVLQNSGLVEVDPVSYNITLHGQNVKLEMDGLPYEAPSMMLVQLPAVTLEQIEVITAPGAKESAEGGTYILNFISKKTIFNNLSGSINGSSYTNHRNGGGISIGYKKNKLNLYTQFYGSYFENNNQNTNERNVFNSPTMYYQMTQGESNNYIHSLFTKIGMDYNFDDNNLMTIYGTYREYGIKSSNLNLSDVWDINNSLQYAYSQSDIEDYSSNSYSLLTLYKKKFTKPGNELTVDAYFTFLKTPNNDGMILDYNYAIGFPFKQNSNTKVFSRTFILRTDYSLPFEKDKFETGYSLTFRNRNNNYDVKNYSYVFHDWQDSLGLSNQFQYKEMINAFYASYDWSLDKLDVKIGIRSENLQTHGDQITQHLAFNQNYFSLFPNINISYSLSDEYQLGLNVFRRVMYPQIFYLNPFKQYQSPNTFYAGNPNLEPSYTSSVSVNFSQYINVYYSEESNVFTYATSTTQDSILFSSYINLNKIQTYGFDLTFSYSRSPRMPFHLPDFVNTANCVFNYTYQRQTGQYLAEDLSMINKTYSLRAILGFTLWFGVDLTSSFYYRPRIENKLTTTSEYKNLSLYLSKSFLDRKLRISFSFLDILNSNKMTFQNIGTDYVLSGSMNPLKSFGIGLGITYIFNNYKDRRETNIDDGRDTGGKGI